MNQSQSPETQMAKFSRLLAELEHRLRHSYVANLSPVPSWPVCSRLAVQANLLGGLAGEWRLDDFAHFAERVSGLASLGLDEPELIPGNWGQVLDRLAALLDDLMSGLDEGDDPLQWLHDPRWGRLAGWFTHLDSPLLVLDEIEEILLRWQDSWCDGPLETGQEKELQQGWARLREFGNALLDTTSFDPADSLLRWPDPEES
jgi:hypothetical protein